MGMLVLPEKVRPTQNRPTAIRLTYLQYLVPKVIKLKRSHCTKVRFDHFEVWYAR